MKKNKNAEKKILAKNSAQDKNIKKKKPVKLNKNKIPIIDKNTDLNTYFIKKDDNIPKVSVKKDIKKTKIVKPKKRKQKPPKKNTPFPVNKNGLPILSKDEDLFKYFIDDEHDNNSDSNKKNISQKKINKKNKIPEENFKKMLEKSLAGKTKEMILLEKHSGKPKGKPLNTSEIIKYYPPSQEELDLHGYTAAEALDANEAFIKKARYKGKRTLLVIVGKGTGTQGKAVLPDVIENQLLALKRKKIVLAYKWDKGIKRKSGALIVYLKNRL